MSPPAPKADGVAREELVAARGAKVLLRTKLIAESVLVEERQFVLVQRFRIGVPRPIVSKHLILLPGRLDALRS